MGSRGKAPGTCVDCGNDAYIRLAGHNGDQVMVCAHCFASRVRSSGMKGGLKAAKSEARPQPDARLGR
jgi:hypothetical protein